MMGGKPRGDGPVLFKVIALGEYGQGPPSVVLCGAAGGVC